MMYILGAHLYSMCSHVGLLYQASPDDVTAFMKCGGKTFLYLLSRIVLISVPGLTLNRIGLLPCSVIIWSVVENDLCPSEATSVRSLPA